MRFPLNQELSGGYGYGVKTSYSAHHLGIDYLAKYVSLYAPENGVIIKAWYGTEGGNTYFFKPDGKQCIIRFLHLSKFIAKQGEHVDEGQIIGITGNTGSESTSAHLHIDYWPKGVVTLLFSDTTNPNSYFHGTSLNTYTMFRTFNKIIYALLEGYWIAIATSGPDFLTDWNLPNYPIEMTEAQFKAFPVNKRTIK